MAGARPSFFFPSRFGYLCFRVYAGNISDKGFLYMYPINWIHASSSVRRILMNSNGMYVSRRIYETSEGI